MLMPISAAKAPHKIGILIVDDHPTFREGLRHLLQAEPDLEVVGMASDGEQAVKKVQELKPDVAIIDIAMPRVSGIEATRRIKALNPATAVIALSAYDYDSYVLPALEAGALGYLLKTTGVSNVVSAVRAVNAGQTVLDPTAHQRLLSRLDRTMGKPARGAGSPQLRRREMEVLALAATGHNNRAIADRLVISDRTVQTHFRNILRRLGVSSRTEAVAKAIRLDLIGPDDTG